MITLLLCPIEFCVVVNNILTNTTSNCQSKIGIPSNQMDYFTPSAFLCLVNINKDFKGQTNNIMKDTFCAETMN